MNLRSNLLLTLLSETLLIAKNLILLDISWCQLCPKELASLSMTLTKNGKQMRNLNLSYNRLNFDTSKAENEQANQDSYKFMDNIKIFFIEAVFVNHVNFSGMNWGQE